MKHQIADHGGSNSPKFIMRVVRSYRSALSRQVGEAVRIRRRGGEGSILNNKSEFNRCKIGRLTIGEEEEQKPRDDDKEEIMEKEVRTADWEQERMSIRRIQEIV